jgi:hypothetical protein
MAVIDFRDYLKLLPAVKQIPHQAAWLSCDSEGTPSTSTSRNRVMRRIANRRMIT